MALTQDQIVSLIRGATSPSEIQAAIQRGDATVPQLMSALQKIYASEGAQRTVYEDGEQPQTYTEDILYGGGFRAWENPPEIIGVTGEGENQQPVYGPRSLGGFTQQIGDTLYVYDTQGQLLRTQSTNRSFGEQIAPVAGIAAMALSAGGAGSLLGGLVAPTATAATQAALGGALLSGGMTAAQGGNAGDILSSAIKGGIPAAIAPVTGVVSEAVGSQALGNAIVSGALSKAQGGDFLQGAIMGGLSGAAKDATMNQVNQYLNTVEPGIPYDASTSPTELDVIQAFPELAPTENLTQGVTDILNYAANAPSVQLAAGPNYVGEFSGMEYDPNAGVYRLEIGGTGEEQGTAPSEATVPTQEQNQIGIDELLDQLSPYLSQTPTLEDIQAIIGQQNFATPEDVQTAINSIDIPQGLSEQDVQNIVSNAFASNPSLTANDVQSIVDAAVSQIPAGLTAQDVANIIGQQRFATPEDVQTAINSIDIPQGLSEQDVQSIVSDAFANNPGLTSSQVSQIVNDAISQIPSGITSESVQSIVDTAISRLPAAPTQQDIINIIGGQGLATGQDLSNLANELGLTQQELFNQIGDVQTNLEAQLGQQGRDFMDYLQQQGFDYETALNEAIAAQQDQFGTALNQTTEDLLGEIAASGAGLQQEFQTGLQGLADQLGITQQELIDQLNQASESFGTQVSGLQEQFKDFGTTNAQQYSDLMKTIGLLGTGLGALQSTFKSAQEASLPKQFEIVAPPSEWKSPTYNIPAPVAFMPQAPIDFGSPELLQGTQFARPQVQATQMPYDLSNVINTLNFQSVPFVQQQVAQPTFAGFANQPISSVGINDIIGGLNGRQVSIADIISGIQSQYGQNTPSAMG